MPDITFDYTPTTGAALNPTGWSKNLYQQTPGKSLYETLNGNVTYANLKSTFQVEAHLIRPGHTGFARSDGRVFAADYFQDLWASGQQSSDYVPIAGACFTARIPFDPTLVLYSASMFLTVWRQFGAPDPGAGAAPAPRYARLATPDILVQTFVGNNEGIVATRREMPQTVFHDPTLPGAPNVVLTVAQLERRTCHQFNLFHAKCSGGTAPFDGQSAGYTSFGFAVKISPNVAGQTTATGDDYDLKLNGDNDTQRDRSYYQAIHRLRAYVRGATIIPLL